MSPAEGLTLIAQTVICAFLVMTAMVVLLRRLWP
jgi:hypothetical protein